MQKKLWRFGGLLLACMTLLPAQAQIRSDNKTAAPPPKALKASYQVSLFPLGFLNRQTYTVAENLVGTVFLNTTKDPQANYAPDEQATMVLDLPPFIRLAGVTDRLIVKRQGEYKQIAYPFTVQDITIDGQPYRRHTISFDSHFVRLLGCGWYYQKTVPGARKGFDGEDGDAPLVVLDRR